MFSINVTEKNHFKNRKRIGASIGIEYRKSLADNFSLDFGFQVKSFRKSFIFNTNEIFIEDLNLQVPILMNYQLKMAETHFLNFKLGLNGVIQTYQFAEFSSLDYAVELYRKPGIFPNIKLGFGYKLAQKKSFEINLLYNMGFLNKNREIVNYTPLKTAVTSFSNGSFVELEIQYRLMKSTEPKTTSSL